MAASLTICAGEGGREAGSRLNPFGDRADRPKEKARRRGGKPLHPDPSYCPDTEICCH